MLKAVKRNERGVIERKDDVSSATKPYKLCLIKGENVVSKKESKHTTILLYYHILTRFESLVRELTTIPPYYFTVSS